MYLTNLSRFYVWIILFLLSVIIYVSPLAIEMFYRLTDNGDDECVVSDRATDNCYRVAIFFFTLTISGLIFAIVKSIVPIKYFFSVTMFTAIVPGIYLFCVGFFALIAILINFGSKHKIGQTILDLVNPKHVLIAAAVLLVCVDALSIIIPH